MLIEKNLQKDAILHLSLSSNTKDAITQTEVNKLARTLITEIKKNDLVVMVFKRKLLN